MCHTPDAAACADFAAPLMACADVNRRIPLERWDRDAIAAPDDIVASNMLRFACFVDRVDAFDGGVFRLASAEATALDPQSRVLLEHTLACLQVRTVLWTRVCLQRSCLLDRIGGGGWQRSRIAGLHWAPCRAQKAASQAGSKQAARTPPRCCARRQPPQCPAACRCWTRSCMQDARPSLAGTSEASTGVYMGSVWQEYPALLSALRVPDSVHALTGSGMNFMVGRVSYTFGLQGAHAMCLACPSWAGCTRPPGLASLSRPARDIRLVSPGCLCCQQVLHEPLRTSRLPTAVGRPCPGSALAALCPQPAACS